MRGGARGGRAVRALQDVHQVRQPPGPRVARLPLGPGREGKRRTCSRWTGVSFSSGRWSSTRRPSCSRCSPAARALLGVELDRRRLGRDRRPLPRHAAHRQPAAAPGARLRRGQGRRPGHPRRRAGRPGALRRRRPRPGPARPRRAGGAGASGSAAGRSASRRSRWPWGRSRTPSRRSASPSSCGPACSPARPAGGSPPRPPGGTSDSPFPGAVASSGTGHRQPQQPQVRRQRRCSTPRLRCAGAQLDRPRPCASRPVALSRARHTGRTRASPPGAHPPRSTPRGREAHLS